MSKEELIKQLIALNNNGDTEANHSNADSLLIDYINDPKVKEAYGNIHKWYA
jgi:hypothetical protein